MSKKDMYGLPLTRIDILMADMQKCIHFLYVQNSSFP